MNFGGWLVLERFLTPSLFRDTTAQDEYSLSLLGKKYTKRIASHQKNFITEADFQWLATQNVPLIRIPVGDWLFGGEEPYIASHKRLDWAFNMAEKYNLSIFLDVHGAKGGQNYAAHCGRKDCGEWINTQAYQDHTYEFTIKLVKRYGNRAAFWGIELLNEPHFRLRNIVTFFRYYHKTKKAIHAIDDTIRIYIGDWYMPYLGLTVARILGVGLDCHFYHAFSGKKATSQKTIFKKLGRSRRFIKFASKISPLMIGEWSVVMGQTHRQLPSDMLKKQWLQEYGAAQLNAYSQAHAWCYFNYKSEGGGTWSFQEMVKTDILDL